MTETPDWAHRAGDPDESRRRRAVERAYYVRTGIHPIMHCVAIRRPVYAANPWIAWDLYDEFSAVKNGRLRP